MKKKPFFSVISVILCFSIIFYGVFVTNLKVAQAYTVFDAPNFVPNTGDWVTNLGDWMTAIGEFAWEVYEVLKNYLAALAVFAAKMVALYAVQKFTAELIGGDSEDSGGSLMIRDYANYLFTAPAQKAMNQMETFYNTVAKGRLSSANYEGVGSIYDVYLSSGATKMIKGGEKHATDIQDITGGGDPRQSLFKSRNMRGVMAYVKCANNLPCFSIMSQTQYDEYLKQNKEQAKTEQNNGLIPQKKLGRIIKPTALISSAFSTLDKMGTDLIMTAEATGVDDAGAALAQIAEGMVISTLARSANYGISDDEGKAAIIAQNNQFPFSTAYNNVITNAVTGVTNKVTDSLNSAIDTVNAAQVGAIGSAVEGVRNATSNNNSDAERNAELDYYGY
ncbi:MAG TPA: hypothetical protein P5548_01595 [Candidatus Moranbacteria bacterium]|nr:hypothetical protein [Candidatus Moranbacteria bacterium]HRZ33576.1 hypothetical protein [Candidatus Moranbacteria bacterium]